MERRIIASFFMVITIFGIPIYSSDSENTTEVLSDPSLNQDVCNNIQQDEIEDVIHQMQLAELFIVEPGDNLVLLLKKEFKDTINFFGHFRQSNKREKIHYRPNDGKEEEFLRMANESIFQFREKGILYHVYPGINTINNEVFAKYITYKVVNNALRLKIVFFLDEMDEVTELQRYFALTHNSKILFSNVSQYQKSIALMQYDSKSIVYFQYYFDGTLYMPIMGTEYWTDNFDDKVIQTINEKLNYAEINATNINFTFSKNQRLTKIINCTESKLRKNFSSDLISLTQVIQTHYLQLEKNSKHVGNLLVELNRGYTEFSQFIKLYHRYEKGLGTMFSHLRELLEVLVVENVNELLSKIIESAKKLDFLQSATGTKVIATQFLKFLIEFSEKGILESIPWYKKLNNLYSESAPYLSNNVRTIMEPKFEQLITLTLSEQNKSEMYNLDVKKKNLYDTKRDILDGGMKKECILIENKELHDGKQKVFKLLLHGTTISFSDIPDTWFNLCEGTIRYLEFFAGDTIIIDKDFKNNEKTLQLVAIAPKLWVMGERTINLNGADGKKHKNEFAQSGKPGRPGDDGIPGLPGEPGGIFIGITEEIINERMLRILANGGKGGPGQHGGDGGRGIEPASPNMDDVYDNDLIILLASKLSYLYPLKRTTGGNGGQGGQAGKGGNAGQIILQGLKENFKMYDGIAIPGQLGWVGKGGAGAAGNISYGKYKSLRITLSLRDYEHEKMIDFENTSEEELMQDKIYSVIKNGTAGESGKNGKDIKLPTIFKGFRDYSFIVNDYKNFIRQYLDKSNKMEICTEFYAKLINSEQINKKYTTLGLLDELKGLEKQFVNLTKKVDLFPMYHNLQKRIEEYAAHRLESESGKDYGVALEYARTAILTKSLYFIDNTDYYVTHLRKYLDLVSRNLNILKENNVVYTANLLGEDYKDDIEQKIKEAQMIIETQLRNEVSKVNNLMKTKTYDLIDEAIKLEKKSYAKRDALRSAKSQQLSFTILKTIYLSIAALVPGGQVAAAVAFTGIMFVENFAPDYQKGISGEKIPTAAGNQVSEALDILKHSKQNQLNILKEEIEFVKNEKAQLRTVNNQPEKVLDTVVNILEDKRKAIEANRTNLTEELVSLEDQLTKLMQEAEEESKYETSDSKVFAVFGKLNVFFIAQNWNYGMPDEVKGDAEKIKKLEEDLESVEDDIKKLQEYKKKIYKEFIPVLESIYRDLPSDKTLSAQSIVALDVSKWKVQAALKNVKLVVRKFTEGFKVADEMKLLIESLENTMNVIISMFNRIQSFQQEKKLVTYINKVSNARFQDFLLKDETLITAMLETRMLICTNLALIQYERVYIAFKQFVFPFAKKYLSDITKPDELVLVEFNDYSSIFKNVSDNVYSIKYKIDEMESADSKNGKFYEPVFLFNNHSGPFQMWKNETHNEMISNFLDGKEVILTPDARKFAFEGVKFKEIKIRLVPKDKNDQEYLNVLLSSLEVRMTHEGDSHYICGNKTYLISRSPITFVRTFNVEHTGMLESVKNFANGEDVASPFATWRIQLLTANMNRIRENYFSDFKNKVDLVLEGFGTFIYPINPICNKNTNLSEYYEEYVSMVV